MTWILKVLMAIVTICLAIEIILAEFGHFDPIGFIICFACFFFCLFSIRGGN